MKKDPAETEYNRPEYAAAAAGLVLLLAVFPFVMQKGYTNVTGVRFLFFTLLSSGVFAACCIAKTLRLPSLRPSLSALAARTTAQDRAFACFFAACAVSALLSPFGGAAVSGNEGRYMGLLFYIAAFAAYIWISRFCVLTEKTLLLLCGACAAAVLFSVLQFEGVDLFGLLKAVPAEKRRNFLSPFGNINVYAAYLSAAAPAAMYMSCFSERPRGRRLFLGLSAAGFTGLFTANSDSAYIAFGVAWLLLLRLCCRSGEALRRFFTAAHVFFVCAAGFFILFRAVNGTRGLSSITEIAVSAPVSFTGAALTGLILLLFRRLAPGEHALRRLRKLSTAVIVLLPALYALALFLFTVVFRNVQLGSFEKYLRFSDGWGTDRGFVWSRLLRCFADAGLKEKLFGYGEDTVALILMRYCGAEMTQGLGYIFDSAHSEPLQYLLTTGLFGLFSYLALVFITVKKGFSRNGTTLQRALALSAVAYFAQSLVNILQPISTPFFFILIGLIGCGNQPCITQTDTDEITCKSEKKEVK